MIFTSLKSTCYKYVEILLKQDCLQVQFKLIVTVLSSCTRNITVM